MKVACAPEKIVSCAPKLPAVSAFLPWWQLLEWPLPAHVAQHCPVAHHVVEDMWKILRALHAVWTCPCLMARPHEEAIIFGLFWPLSEDAAGNTVIDSSPGAQFRWSLGLRSEDATRQACLRAWEQRLDAESETRLDAPRAELLAAALDGHGFYPGQEEQAHARVVVDLLKARVPAVVPAALGQAALGQALPMMDPVHDLPRTRF